MRISPFGKRNSLDRLCQIVQSSLSIQDKTGQGWPISLPSDGKYPSMNICMHIAWTFLKFLFCSGSLLRCVDIKLYCAFKLEFLTFS